MNKKVIIIVAIAAVLLLVLIRKNKQTPQFNLNESDSGTGDATAKSTLGNSYNFVVIDDKTVGSDNITVTVNKKRLIKNVENKMFGLEKTGKMSSDFCYCLNLWLSQNVSAYASEKDAIIQLFKECSNDNTVDKQVTVTVS